MVNSSFRRHGLHLLRGEGVRARFDAAFVLIEEAQVIVDEADQPDLVVHLAGPNDLESRMPQTAPSRRTPPRRSSGP